MTTIHRKYTPKRVSAKEEWEFPFEDHDYLIRCFVGYDDGEIAEFQVDEIMWRSPATDGRLSFVPEITKEEREHWVRVKDAFMEALNR